MLKRSNGRRSVKYVEDFLIDVAQLMAGGYTYFTLLLPLLLLSINEPFQDIRIIRRFHGLIFINETFLQKFE